MFVAHFRGGGALQRLSTLFDISYRQKILLLATVPLVIAATIIALVVTQQSRKFAEREIAALESQLIEAKKDELLNYISLARTAFMETYGHAAPDDEAAKLRVTQILSSMIYGQDGYFFVFDYDGNNLVAPRQTYLINKNWNGLKDLNGVPITDRLIELARTGGGYHSFDWIKPSTRETAPMIVYVVGLPDWRWAIGTGLFVDDIRASVTAARADVETRVRTTGLWILSIAMAALLAVYLTGLVINIRERRVSEAKLKNLTQRIFDTQEEERGRVARELHDSISQILVGTRYALELARRRIKIGDPKAGESIDKGIESLGGAIGEVRRISRDLRPGMLDDLGLGPALKALTTELSERTGIKTDFETVVFRNRLDSDAKIALYRVAQEALTNIERHSNATEVEIKLSGHRKGATLKIADNGIGMQASTTGPGGLGLRNMQERVENLNGSFRILSTKTGTVIEARVPLSHMLPPSQTERKSA